MSMLVEVGKTAGTTVIAGAGTVLGGLAVKAAWNHSDKLDSVKEKLPGFSATDNYTYSLIEEARKGASYLYLWDRLHRNANGIGEDVRADIRVLNDKIPQLDLPQITDFFSGLSKQCGMHPLEITYLLTPEKTPWGYYCWRKVTDPLLYIGNLLWWSIRSVMSYAAGQIIGWVTGLPIWRFASAFKRLFGW